MAAKVKPIHPGLADLLEYAEEWGRVLRRYLVTLGPRNNISDDEKEAAQQRMRSVLKVILQFLIQNAPRHENWPPLLYSLDPYGMTMVARAKKQDHEYDFGIQNDAFFLQTMILSPRYVKVAGMEYWRHMVELDALGCLSFEENEGVTLHPGNKAFAHTLKVGKSPIYCLIRNLVLMEASGQEIDEGGPGKGFGWLRLAWRCDTPWGDVLRNGATAFQHLYQMNYTLYRQQYLYERGIMKRIRRQQGLA